MPSFWRYAMRPCSASVSAAMLTLLPVYSLFGVQMIGALPRASMGTNRSPSARPAGNRTHVLRMAVPTPPAQIHLAAELLKRRIIGGVGHCPLELTKIGPDHGGHVGRPRRRLNKG